MQLRSPGLISFLFIYFLGHPLWGQYNASLHCDSAPFLSCGDAFFLGDQFISKEYLNTCLANASLDRETNVWRRFLGNGQTLQFIPTTRFDAINIYEGDCEDLVCSYDAVSIRDGLEYHVNLRTIPSKEYKILLTSTSLTDLESRCITPTSNTFRSNAQPLICGSEIQVDLNNALAIVECEDPSLFQIGDRAPRLWYSYTGKGNIVSLDWIGHRFHSHNMVTHVFKKTSESTCLDLVTHGNGSIRFKAELETNYFIAISANIINSFSFGVSCHPQDPNDECETASSIVCGDTIRTIVRALTQSTVDHSIDYFRHFSGNNQYIRPTSLVTNQLLEFEVTEGRCALANNPINSRSDREVFLKKDQDYTLRFKPGANPEEESLYLECLGTGIVSVCEQAIPITCDNIYADSLRYEPPQNIPGVGVKTGKWYSITGVNQIITVEPVVSNYSMWVFRNSCDQLDRLNNGHHTFEWFGEEDSTYFIFISNSRLVHNYSFEISCEPPAPNRNSENAITIRCNEQINVPFDESYGRSDCDNFPNPLYYKYYNNTSDTIKLEWTLSSFYVVKLFEIDPLLTCPNKDRVLLPGDSVLIELSNTFNNSTFELNCIPVKSSVPCEAAEVINFACDTTLEINFPAVYSLARLPPCGFTIGNYSYLRYKFTGEDSLFVINKSWNANFRLYLLQGECNDQVCQGEINNTLRIRLEKDTTYFLYLETRSTSVTNSLEGSIEIICSQESPLSNCDTNEEVYCGEEITVNNTELPNRYFFHSLTGTGQLVAFENRQNIRSRSLYLDCSLETQIDPLYSNTYFLEDGANYIIRNEYYTSILQNPEYFISCFDPNPTINCDSITYIDQCYYSQSYLNTDYTYTHDFTPYTKSDSVQGRWFGLIGDNKYYTLRSNHSLLINEDPCISMNPQLIEGENFEIFLSDSDTLLFLSFDTSASYQYVGINISCTTRNPEPILDCSDFINTSCNQIVYLHPDADDRRKGACEESGVQRAYVRMIGTGKFVTVQNNVFGSFSWNLIKGDCYTGQCIDRLSNTVFLENNQEYYFEFHRFSRSLEIQFTCNAPTQSGSKENPIDLGCTSSYLIDLIYNPTTRSISSCVTQYEHKGEWFSVVGNGMTMSLEYYENYVRSALFEVIGSDTVCAPFQFIGYAPTKLQWPSIQGRSYLIYLYNDYRTPDPFTITLNCFRQSSNDFCEDAIPIDCNSSFIRYNSRGSTSDGYDCNYAEGLDQYYIVQGTNDYYHFSNKVEVLQGSCDEFECVDSERIRNEDVYLMKEGHQYIVKTLFIDDYLSDMTMGCSPAINPNNCINPVVLTKSDTTITGDLTYVIPTHFANPCNDTTFAKGIYYDISGLDPYLSISVSNLDLYVLSGSCASLYCNNEAFRTNIYYLPPGQRHYLFLTPKQYRNNFSYELIISSVGGVAPYNFNCTTPVSLNCNAVFPLNFNENIRERNRCLPNANYHNEFFQPKNRISFQRIKISGDTEENIKLTIREDCSTYYNCEDVIVDIRNGDPDPSEFYIPPNLSGEARTVVFSIHENTPEQEYSVNVDCYSPIFSDPCNAETITPGPGKLKNNAFRISKDVAHHNPDQFNGTWYKINKLDQYFDLTFSLSEASSSRYIHAEFIVFAGNKCTNLNRQGSYFWDDPILLDPDTEYYILVLINKKYIVDYFVDLSVSENPPPPPGNFVPPTITCDTTFIIDFWDLYAPDSCFTQCTRDYSFDIIGTGAFYTLSGLPEGSDNTIYPDFSFQSKLTNTVFLMKDTAYTVYISNANKYAFSDSVRLECIEPIIQDPPIQSITLNCVDTIRGSTRFQAPTEDSHLMIPIDLYSVAGDGKFYSFGPSSDFSGPDLFILLRENIPNGRSHIQFANERELAHLKSGIEYTIGIFPYNRLGADYTMVIQCEEPQSNVNCLVTPPVACGDELILNFEGAIETAEDELFYQSNSRNLFYNLEITDQELSFSGQNRTLVIHEDSCSSASRTYVYRSFSSPIQFGGTVSTILAFNERSNLRDTVTIECSDIIVHDAINSYYDISCTDTIEVLPIPPDEYYNVTFFNNSYSYILRGIILKITGGQFIGTLKSSDRNQFESFQIITTNEAGQLVVEEYINDYRFEENKEYFVFAQIRNEITSSADIFFICHPIPINTHCREAFPLACGVQYEVDFRYTQKDSLWCEGFSNDADYRKLYYTYTGENLYFSIASSSYSSFRYNVLSGNCNMNECLDPVAETWYWGEVGQEYLVELYFGHGSSIKEFTLRCAPPVFGMGNNGDPDVCNTIGRPCDDANYQTVNDLVNEDCICTGVRLQDLICENDSLYIYTIDTGYHYFHTRDILITNGKILPFADILFKSGNRVELRSGFEIFENASFEVNIEDCPDNRPGGN